MILQNNKSSECVCVFLFFIGKQKIRTLILCDGTLEIERSLQDAIVTVCKIYEKKAVVGGGAIEMELSKMLREHSRTYSEEKKPVMEAIANAFEIIPHHLCERAGFDASNVLEKLREKHTEGKSLRNSLVMR